MTQLLKIGVTPLVTPVLAQVANSSQNSKIAEDHFKRGIDYFDRDEYEKAIEEFQKAYDLTGRPSALKNIGTCYKELHKPKEACEAYRLSLEKGLEAPKRKEVEKFIAELQCVQPQPKPEPLPIVPQPAPPPTPPNPPPDIYIPPPPGEGHPIDIGTSKSNEGSLLTYRNLKWTSVGLGVAGLVTGLIASIATIPKENEYFDMVNDLRSRGEIFDRPGGEFVLKNGPTEAANREELNNLKEEAETRKTIANTGFISFGVLLGLGGLFYLLDRKDTRAIAAPNAKGTQVGLEFYFK